MQTVISAGPPKNVTVTSLSSTSLLLKWIAPTLNFKPYSKSIIEGYTVSCNSIAGYLVDEATTAKNHLEYEMHSFQPFSNYTCCVKATTTIGSTPKACQTTQTMEDSE